LKVEIKQNKEISQQKLVENTGLLAIFHPHEVKKTL